MPYTDALLVWRELEDHPSIRMMFAHFVGYKKPVRFTGKEASADDFIMAQKIMGAAQPMPPEMKAALQWAEEMKRKHPGLKNA